MPEPSSERSTAVQAGFLAELRRRRVLRTLALYIVAAWVLMQVADVLFPALGIPDAAIRYLLLAAVLGFPVALVFAWLFNITPEGIRRTGRPGAGESAAVEPLQKRDYFILALLTVVLGLIVYGAVDRAADAPLVPTPNAPSAARAPRGDGPPTLAVLPFSFRGAGGDAEFFAAGVHDDLLTQLSQLSGLRIISRTSVLQYEGTTEAIPEIGRALGADAILEGGVQLAGEQIRINAQLIDARSDEHLWASTFDRKLTPDNIFAVQGEISRAIATALQTTLTPAETSQLDLIPTSNMAAYRAFHEGMNQPVTRREEALDLLQQAIDLDPDFTRAMAELVGMLTLMSDRGEDVARVKKAEALIDRLGELAPDSVHFLEAQAFYTYYVMRDYALANELLSEALKLAPSDTRLLEIQMYVSRRQTNHERTLELTRQISQLRPEDSRWRSVLALRLFTMRRYDEALEAAQYSEDEDKVAFPALVMLSLYEHRDLQRYRSELKRLYDSPSSRWKGRLLQNLYDAHLALRDFEAARELNGRLYETFNPTDMPPGFLPLDLIMNLDLHLVTGNATAVKATLVKVSEFMELERGILPTDLPELTIWDRVPVAVALGDQQASRAVLDNFFLYLKKDLAEYRGQQRFLCIGLALIGDAPEGTACLRRALGEVGSTMPFFDPLLPHYDGIRESPEFKALMRELIADGWFSAASLDRLP